MIGVKLKSQLRSLSIHFRLKEFLRLGMSSRGPITSAYHRAQNKIDVMGSVNFCFSLPEMAELSPYDRTVLVGSNRTLIHGFQLAWAFSKQVLRDS